MAGKYMKSRFFNSIRGDRRYFAEEFAEYFASFIGNGVYPLSITGEKDFSGLKCTRQRSGVIKVTAGGAFIRGYFGVLPEDISLEVGSSAGYVVVRLDIDERLVDITTISSLNDITRNDKIFDLVIASYTANAGTVTDMRDNKEYCGWVETLISGSFDQIKRDMDAFIKEVTNDMNTLRGDMKNIAEEPLGRYRIYAGEGLAGGGLLKNNPQISLAQVRGSFGSQFLKGSYSEERSRIYFKGKTGFIWFASSRFTSRYAFFTHIPGSNGGIIFRSNNDAHYPGMVTPHDKGTYTKNRILESSDYFIIDYNPDISSLYFTIDQRETNRENTVYWYTWDTNISSILI